VMAAISSAPKVLPEMSWSDGNFIVSFSAIGVILFISIITDYAL